MTTDRRSCAVSFLQDRDCSPAGETRMNANHSFRTSITVLTVATIVGCAVMVLSGFSQFRLRPATNDKALVSTANQKLRNRFGEFYPVESRVPATNTNSSATNVMQNVSQSSTFDEVVTTKSEYDHSEVITSWSSGTSGGVPQVSVPVTINVNNGELMAQLIETRESLAEVKAQQTAIRQGQRVFSYEVHKGESVETGNSSKASATAEISVGAKSSDRESIGQSTQNTSKAQAVSLHKGQIEVTQREQSTAETQKSSEVHSASRETTGRSTSRMRSLSETGSVHQATQGASRALPLSTETSASESLRVTETTSVKNSVQATEASRKSEFEGVEETSSGAESPDFSMEEEISFEAIPQPVVPPADDNDVSVPVIEPISYNVEETIEESRSASVTEETVVEFGALEKATAAETPASLPELSFEEPKATESSELPVLSLDQATTSTKSISSRASETSDKSSGESHLPTFFGAEENAVSEQTASVADRAVATPELETAGRTREQLASAFAAVRGLPPEDLFGDRTIPFVAPIEPAEPVNEASLPGFAFAESDSKSGAEASIREHITETAPPTISFGESAGGSLVVRPSSAAAPVELEFGEASAPNPALAHSETPGAPVNPVMPPAEPKPERWHKYRSRIHLRSSTSPSTPVPPVPELAGSSVSEVPLATMQEPSLVPPVPDDSSGKFLAESDVITSDSDRTITDSPLMIPDEDGSTELAQNSDSGKLGSSTLPPVPELAPVPQLTPVPELQLPLNATPTDSNLVYEPQPVMDRLNEVTAETSASPVFYPSPPMMAQRTMPQKSANKRPFETTFRRVNKRVAWMADALGLPEKKTAQQKPMTPRSPGLGRPQQSPQQPTQRHGQAVAKKKSPSTQMQLPKFTVPKFAVQNFALPNVNFRPIQAPSFHMPTLDTPDWLACPPDVMAPVRNSTAIHRVMSTMQFAGQPQVVN